MNTRFSDFLILVLLLLPICALSIDTSYEACKPYECGGLSISYPFYVPSIQPSFCGQGRFNVSCNRESQTIIPISGDDYIINDINYEEMSINITNSAFSSSDFSCTSSSIHNVTLDGDDRFNTSFNHKYILLLHNCSRTPAAISKNYTEIKCQDNEHPLWAVSSDDFYPSEFGLCKNQVQVPYDEDESSSSSSIEGLLSRGCLLKYKTMNCSHCRDSGGRCGLDGNTSEFLCYCPDRPRRSSCLIIRKGRVGLKLGIGISSVGALGCIALCCYCLRRFNNSSFFSIFQNRQTRANLNIEAFLKSYGSVAPKRCTFSDLKKITTSFNEKIGQGGYGTVYKGKSPDGRLVAVKLLKQSKGDGEDFINEVASISRTNLVNIVTLLGFCIEGSKRTLVFEFMVNGSLDKFTKGEVSCGQSLTWEVTFQIVLGIARGLEYLHRGCNTRILHFDIKPHNILLDEKLCPKISDFGLAKLYPQDDPSRLSMSMATGTIGYIAPEVFCRNFGGISHKSDVYSYGMMVLEVIGSRRRMKVEDETQSSDSYFPDWIYKQLEEEDVDDDDDKELKRKMMLVSLWCIQTIPSSRPSMSRVVQMLEASVETLEIPPMPSLSSPRRPQLDTSWSSTVTLR